MNNTFSGQNTFGNSVVATLDSTAQKSFLIKTYTHLLLAIAIFAATIFAFSSNATLFAITMSVYSIPFAGLIIMAVLIGASMLASYLASSTTNRALHYVGLIGYALVEGFITVPIVAGFLFNGSRGGNLLAQASGLTVLIFAILTAVVFITKPNLSFLAKLLPFAGISSIVLIILSIIFGFTLGVWFSIAMIMLASSYILFETSNMTQRYNSTQYVASALALFSSVVMLFWYIIRFFQDR
jgi:uncharacterized protein